MNKIKSKSNSFLKGNIVPIVSAILIFLAITVVYFSPVLEGKKLKQHDIAMFKGMSKEIVDHRETKGEEPLWTNSMFGGMPAWQISVKYNGNLMSYIDKVVTLWLPYPMSYVFLYFLGFFILMLVLRVNPWVGAVGAIAFALSSYFFIILGAGHTSKAHAIGYMAPVLAGIILAFRGKYWQGGLLTAIALSLEIYSGHLQITYYLLIVVIIYGVYQLIDTIKTGNYSHFLKAAGILILAAILSILTYTTNLWATYDYGKDTMRGKPELTKEADVKSGGLDKDYITHWSYGIAESWSLMIPNVKGGASGILGNVDAIKKADPAYRNAIAQQTNSYWGDQPGISGPVYVGIIVVFLFILGMFVVRDKIKWPLFAAALLSILLAWGKNWMPLTDFFIDYIPGYNKFRAVSMIMVIAEFVIPVLAFLALGKIIQDPSILKKNKNALYISFGLTGGLALLFYLTPSTFFSFTSANEKAQFAQLMQSNDANQVKLYLDSLKNVRMEIFKADALRGFFYVLIAGVLVYLFMIEKVKKTWLILGIGILIVADMATINRRYLNNDNFVRAKLVDVPFTASAANKFILNDNSDFRVLDITKSTFNDASCSYFHKSIGGYHGAKLQRYQDLIEYNIQDEIQTLIDNLSIGSLIQINEAMKKLDVLNMLNTKYVLYNPDAQPLTNYSAFGSAWFVNNVIDVTTPDEEIAELKNYNLRNAAIVDVKFSDQIKADEYPVDSNAAIIQESYAPNHIVYSFESAKEQLTVFSEIYYDKGWNAYIDGKEAPYFRANYVLRAMVIPAGQHVVEFKFEPRIYTIGERISFVSSLILILLLIGGLYIEGKKYFLNTSEKKD